MPIDSKRFQELLSEFKLKQLFIEELGWDQAEIGAHDVRIDEEVFQLDTIAQKRGVAVFLCSPDAQGEIPNYSVRLKIEKEAQRIVHEHLLIFADAAKSTLAWLWSSRSPGQPVVTRRHTWQRGTSGESLRQKLEAIVWSLEDEEAITLTDVITGLKKAFDRDRVSKKFYTRFKSEHEAFADFIAGLAKESDKTWYASLMLNRLMFVYFIQRKGFLDGNINYLANRLQRVRAKAGEGHFHSFYRVFLRRMFHEGLGTPKDQRSAAFNELVGDVPYLNGGLFDPHELEEANPGIDIPDEAFEKLFTFFDDYDWHLDDRPLAKDNEINPDVLGYIFEKYINQKQMGAYYTKEDITEYISKNTVIPHLLEQARKRCKVAFEGEESVWNLLKADPDRYLYPAMKTGVVDGNGDVVPESALPEFVQTGMRNAKARMFDKRYNLGEAQFFTATGERGTLPTETWREYVERRGRCLEIRKKLAAGEIKSADDLITLNLDIRQFMQDVVDTSTSTSPSLLRAIWQAIVGRVPERSHEKFHNGITILDPTCGSGAFLFAALNILEPLYEACLDRMEGFVEDARKLGRQADEDFVKVLNEVGSHPSRSYFVFKSIILHNLYGVDIMAEAVEICKLRLFLKLVSQVNSEWELEPLPDIDFNIRTGNTLVGYATEAQFDPILASKMVYGKEQDHKAEIKVDIADLADLFDRFREQQTVRGGIVTPSDKRALRNRLGRLSLELDRYLARDYGIEPENLSAFGAWRESHQPFHWFAEFYGVMRGGGFDVVIGNPPYVEYSKVSSSYQIEDYQTYSCGNLYAYVLERVTQIINRKSWTSMVVPLSGHSTQRMSSLTDTFYRRFGLTRIMNISADAHPSVLFPGVKFRLSIFICSMLNRQSRTLATTGYRRWFSEERATFFDTTTYQKISENADVIPKVGSQIHWDVLKILGSSRSNFDFFAKDGRSVCLYHNTPVNWIRAHTFEPYFNSDRDGKKRSTQLKEIRSSSPDAAFAKVAVLSSSLFFLWWISYSDCYHLNKQEVKSFPIDSEKFKFIARSLSGKARKLEKDLQYHSTRRVYNYKASGRVEYDEYYPKLSKDIIDELDVILARAFDLPENALDAVVNFEIKYRMGRS